jgi:hypothetical protein
MCSKLRAVHELRHNMLAGAVCLLVAGAGLATVWEPRTAPAYRAAPRAAPAGDAAPPAHGPAVPVNAGRVALVIMPHIDSVHVDVSVVHPAAHPAADSFVGVVARTHGAAAADRNLHQRGSVHAFNLVPFSVECMGASASWCPRPRAAAVV